MKLPSFAALAISALVVLSSGLWAQAATWTVDQQNPGSLYEDAGGNNAWVDNVNVFLTGEGDFDVGAGMFRLTADDGEMVQNFVAFCVELTQFIALPDEYSDTLVFSTSVLNNINSLVSNAFALIMDSATAAAFQVALWEIITDAVLDLDNGDFRLNSSDLAATGTTAEIWLANISGGTWVPSAFSNFVLIESPDSQNLLALNLETTAVPLPAPGLLLLAALAGLAGLRRMRRPA